MAWEALVAAGVSAASSLMSSSKSSKSSSASSKAQLAYQQQALELQKWALKREQDLYDPVANEVKRELLEDSEANVQREVNYAGSLVDAAYDEKVRDMEAQMVQTMPGSGLQAGLLTGMRVMGARDKALAQYTAGKAARDSIMGQRLAFIGRYSPSSSAAQVGQAYQSIASTYGQQSAMYANLAMQGAQSAGNAISNYATYLALSGKGD